MSDSLLDARTAWNAGADAYIHFVESGADYYRHLVHGPGLLTACGNVRGCRALDLGCGHGYFSRLLGKAGAKVTAIDLSDRLLARAMELEAAEPHGISYIHLDAANIGARFAKDAFDLITGCMSVQDMDDPASVLGAARQLLTPRGRLVFSIPHPCTDTPAREWRRTGDGRKIALSLDRYFESGPSICHWAMGRLTYHWKTPFRRFTLTEWSKMIQEAGLVIQELAEPRPSADLIAECPKLEDCARMPYFLIFVLARADFTPPVVLATMRG